MAAVAWGVDAASPVSVQTLKDQGASFICLYLAPYPAQGWKMRSPVEWRNYLNNGFKIVANWESDGTPKGGRAGGVAAAKTAQEYLNDRGCSDAVVYFSAADKDPTALDLNALAEYHRGNVDVLGYDRVGAYGGYGAIKFLADKNICKYYWQTYAWSHGMWDSRAQLRQWKNTQTIDFDQAWNVDFGQYPRVQNSAPAPAPLPPPVTAPVSVAKTDRQIFDEVHDQLCQSWNHPGPPAGPGQGWPVELIADTHYQICDVAKSIAALGPIYQAIQQSYATIQSDIDQIKKALNIAVPPSA